MQGHAGSGLAAVEEALRKARETGIPIAVAFSLAINEVVRWLRGDVEACARASTETRALTEQLRLPFWRAHSEMFSGRAAALARPGADAVGRVHTGLDAWIRTAARLHVPTWSRLLARAALEADEERKGPRSVVGHARAVAAQNGELLMMPELLRLAAELERRAGNEHATRTLLGEVLALSVEHGSHRPGLRIATDLAVSLQGSGDIAAGLSLLEGAAARVEEGHACPPLRPKTASGSPASIA